MTPPTSPSCLRNKWTLSQVFISKSSSKFASEPRKSLIVPLFSLTKTTFKNLTMKVLGEEFLEFSLEETMNFWGSRNVKTWNLSTKGKDLSESGKQKPWTHFLLKIQILNRECWSHLPMKGKTLGSHSQERIFGVLFLFQEFIGKWPSHSRFKIWILSKKWVQGFCLPDSLQSQPLAQSYASLPISI